MAYNKVVYDGDTLIDLTQDDVTPSDVKSGVYFHGADGVRTQGTMVTYTLYPVGAIFETADSTTDPTTLYGGSWSMFGQLVTSDGVELMSDDTDLIYAQTEVQLLPTYKWIRIALPTT